MVLTEEDAQVLGRNVLVDDPDHVPFHKRGNNYMVLVHKEMKNRATKAPLYGLDLPMNGGHPVKGVYSPWEVHLCHAPDVSTPRSSRSKPSNSSPKKTIPSPRPPVPWASATT